MIGGTTGDTVVALIGLVMALVLVFGNARLRGLPTERWLRMGAIWAVLIVLAALAFSGFRR